MNTLLTWLLSVASTHHKTPVRLFQIRYQRAIRGIRALLLPPALTREV
ncbi:hypothetical protein [Methylobacter sp. S3L5C]|nr:hypothetical protein [Methylobacter sp. S3L5C]UOA08626.1 hypothetical protein KKZ03_20955 [Methylobacter sp. S3L5C]